MCEIRNELLKDALEVWTMLRLIVIYLDDNPDRLQRYISPTSGKQKLSKVRLYRNRHLDQEKQIVMSELTQERDVRQQLLDLAREVILFRIGKGIYFNDLAKRTRKVAIAVARANFPLNNAIVDLFADQQDRYDRQETLGWHYRRAYGSANINLDPFKYFTVTYENNFVTISSLSVDGASGEIRINERSVNDIFWCVEYSTPSSYFSWADDPYPVGGCPLLLRMDDVDLHYGQVRLMAEDLHPCRGDIYFGETSQESLQIAAFCRLEEHVRRFFSEKKPTVEERVAAQKRAAEIIAHAGTFCFFPHDGYCSCCGSDVTIGVSDLAGAASNTGCNLCGRSWCD